MMLKVKTQMIAFISFDPRKIICFLQYFSTPNPPNSFPQLSLSSFDMLSCQFRKVLLHLYWRGFLGLGRLRETVWRLGWN
mmetsp:Transcript_16983/g.20969  ORF Transcript_16983/g.20969 Transcript_16983/m.20969 type:complete len:80 (+) Transcript_16983:90-329(+)